MVLPPSGHNPEHVSYHPEDSRWDISAHCEVGYRPGVATSLLERLMFFQLYHVRERPAQWEAPGPERRRRRRH